MLLNELHLTNFRCFPKLSLPLDGRLNVFIGSNGAGKSALLNAIALSLAPILSRLPGLSGPSLKRLDIRLIDDDVQEPYARVEVSASRRTGHFTPRTPPVLSWDRMYTRDKSAGTRTALPKSPRGVKVLHDWIDSLTESFNAKRPFELPVFAFYGTNRAVDVPHHRLRETRKRKSSTRFDALADALNPSADFRRAVAWFDALESQELRRKEEGTLSPNAPRLLDPVRRAVERMLPGVRRPRIDAETSRFVVDWAPGEGPSVKLFLDQLSDGYQVMLGVVLDFALRLVLANPSTPESPDPLASEAIMIVDEVDLHLHPSWQQRVIPDLLRTFPATQFILTTHSPQVLSTVKKQYAKKLKDLSWSELPTEIIGAESGRVLEDAFDVPVRPETLDEVQLLERYINLADSPDADPKQVADLRKQVLATFTDAEPAIELTDMAIEQRRLLGNLNLQLPPIPAPQADKDDIEPGDE